MKSKLNGKEDEILGYLKEGKTYSEIVKLTGLNKSQIRRFSLNNSSILSSDDTIDWEKEKPRLRELYQTKRYSQQKISEILGSTQRTVSYWLSKFGIVQERHPREQKICPECGKFFTPKYEGQIYCSRECSLPNIGKSSRKLPNDEILIKTLNENSWNYSKVGKIFGVSDQAIRKIAKRGGYFKPKQTNWSDVVDLESAQKKINELGIKTVSELNKNYGGLSDKLERMGFYHSISLPGLKGFDSSWEERVYTLVKDNISYTSLEHNIVLDPECRYKNPLVFDVVITYPDFHRAVIEIQGPTHFRTIHDSEGSRLEDVRARDEVKYQYCISHDIDIYYFTYESSLLEEYGYPYPVYTDENLLLEKLKSYLL